MTLIHGVSEADKSYANFLYFHRWERNISWKIHSRIQKILLKFPQQPTEINFQMAKKSNENYIHIFTEYLVCTM